MTNHKMPELPKTVGYLVQGSEDVWIEKEPVEGSDLPRAELVRKSAAIIYGQACWDAANEDALARIKELEAKLAEAKEILEICRDYVVADLEHQRQAFKGYEHVSDIKSIEDDLRRIDAAIGAEGGDD